jgi:hypothetical protein
LRHGGIYQHRFVLKQEKALDWLDSGRSARKRLFEGTRNQRHLTPQFQLFAMITQKQVFEQARGAAYNTAGKVLSIRDFGSAAEKHGHLNCLRVQEIGLAISKCAWIGCSTGASRDSDRVWGAFVWGCRRCEPVCDGTCFPRGMFLHCASNAVYCMSTRKRAWQRMPLLHSPWAKSLSFRGYPGGRLAEGDGRGSRTAAQVWFGIAVAGVLTDSPFGTPREPIPQIPASPEEAPDSARSHTRC